MNSSDNPNTPKSTHSKKRELTSPEFEAESKKNKFEANLVSYTDLPPLPESPESPTMATDHGTFDTTSSETSILIPPSEMLKLSEMLKDTFRGEIGAIVTDIVTGVLKGLEARISTLEKTNSDLRKVNKSLITRVATLESQVDQAEQYSRWNCLRVSGYKEETTEVTDDIILKLAADTGSSITPYDIDRSHRVGNPTSPKRKVPRDIIVKFSTYRARANFYKTRTNLKTVGHDGVFVNEDLTKKRNGYLYEARKLVKRDLLKGAWSSDGTILIKDNKDDVFRITSLTDLIPFGYTPPPPKRYQARRHRQMLQWFQMNSLLWNPTKR